MKKLYKAILAAGISLGAFSCTPYLDMAPTDSVSDKLIWETTQNAEYHVNYIYTYLYDLLMNQCAAGQTEALTDMMKYGSYNYNALCYIPSEIAYGVEQTLSAGYVSTYLGYWGTWYQGIAKTNKAIDCLKRYGQMSDEDKLRLEAEIKFMRASLYFDLMKRYKEIIIYDEDLLAYSKDKELSTEAQGWDFIYNDLKFATDYLPAREAANGRLNKGMAWAFMTRAMLYAERWEEVKTAAEEVEKLGYGLEADYADAYSKAVNAGNNEAIIQYLFDRTNDVTHSFDFYYTPGGDYALHGETGGGYGTPTQEMVESYELATGGAANWAAWHGTTTQTPPYADLEPRFHATILYNGAQWKGRSIEPFVGGVDGWCQWNLDREPMGRTTTGYYLRKLVDESHDVIAYSGGVQPLTIMRYAEVLLNKAEACYRLDMSAEANEAVKAVRARVGLPYTDKGGSALWDAIRQERKVELAFEGLWYWDLRRWGVAHKQYPEGLSGYQQHGLKIENNGDGTFTYTYVSVDDQDRNFPEKMYRFPMPSGELNNNALVEQYPEWK
ncbi:MAG: RagB/SusD family nutrient uptake outer membrane protein [Bacteroidales bacterium]|nr:RagB/SusD family nutrient uptake outer membrane protein [Bacteroidales bacterium]